MGADVSFDCPTCGSSSTQKVSLVWESGTTRSTSQLMGVMVGTDGNLGLGLGEATISGSSQTELAARLRPPRPKRDESPFIYGVGAVFAYILIVIGLGAMDRVAKAILILAGCGTMAVFVAWGVIAHRAAVRHNRFVFQEARRRWAESWVCQRCGRTFIPSG